MCKKTKKSKEGRKKEERKKSSQAEKNAIFTFVQLRANKKIQLQGNTMHGRFMQFYYYFFRLHFLNAKNTIESRTW